MNPSSGLQLNLAPTFSPFPEMVSQEFVTDYSGATAPDSHGLP